MNPTRSEGPGQITIEVRPEEKHLRLDHVITERLQPSMPGVTRSAIRAWFDDGRIRMGAAAVRPSARAVVGAAIVIDIPPPPVSALVADPSVKLSIVYADADIVVIDKPAGLVVHPGKGHREKTLVHGILSLGDFSDDGTGRPGIVHRIDKDTSGLLVVAKTALAREHLKEQFSSHSIERVYWGLAIGQVHDARFETLHGRHPTDRLRFTTQVSRGRRAVTNVRVLEAFECATLVECRLETGRTHQIRVHLAECAKAPLLGDAVYGGAGRRLRTEPLRSIAVRLNRQALHARVLGLEHPTTGESMRWESPLPEDLSTALEALRATKSP